MSVRCSPRRGTPRPLWWKGPRRSLSLKLSNTRVCEPQIRARLGTNVPNDAPNHLPALRILVTEIPCHDQVTQPTFSSNATYPYIQQGNFTSDAADFCEAVLDDDRTHPPALRVLVSLPEYEPSSEPPQMLIRALLGTAANANTSPPRNRCTFLQSSAS